MNYELFRSIFHILNSLNWSMPNKGGFKEGTACEGNLVLSGSKALDDMMNLAAIITADYVNLEDLQNIRFAIQHHRTVKLNNEEDLKRSWLDFELIAFAPSNDYYSAQAVFLDRKTRTLFWIKT